MVEEAQADSKHHVNDAKDNRHLHFKGVEKGQFIGSNVPDLSQSKETKKHYKEFMNGTLLCTNIKKIFSIYLL